MAERLVTLEDLAKYPELRLRGVSLNQHFDFFYLEQAEIGNQYQRPIPQQSIQTPEGTVTTIHVPNNVHEHKRQPANVEAPAKKGKPAPVPKKEAPVKKAAPKEAVKKPVPVKAVKQVPVKKAAKVIPVKNVASNKQSKKKSK